MKNVLLLETVAEDADEILRKNTRVIEAYHPENPLEKSRQQPIHAIVTRGKGQVNRKLLQSCPDLEVVARCGVGLDNVDVDEATRQNVRVINAPGSNAATIAEHTLTLMLMSVRNAWKSAERVKAGDWEWRNQYTGDELSGKTLGILGMGNIGKRVARLADAFGMAILYWDKFTVESEHPSASMEDVLKQADVVTVHVPLVKETEKMIGEKEFGFMQPHAFLINTSRGAVIDEEGLISALNQKNIAGFAADVLAEEPPEPDHPLINHPKTLITPHSGSLTASTYRFMCVSAVNNVIAVLSGEEPEPHSVFNRKDLVTKQSQKDR
ncbi:MAG: hydroxyacid dehydrogenase [Balneolaceae bacterium]|nr:hydroxyacid dehydrogenase [Balneolaceae bacterium]